jgi:hypothetical protein
MITRTLEGYQNLKHLDLSFEPDRLIEIQYDIMKPILELIPIEEFPILLAHNNYLIRELSQKEYDRRNG